MPTIDLLRHGDTGQRGFRGQLDDALSTAGWEQMRAAVAGRRWDVVVSSPLQRCAAFAQELAARGNAAWYQDARLAEYHFGRWQDLALETIAERQAEALARFWSDPAGHPPPGAEPFAAFEARIRAALDAMTHMARRRVLVVTHGGVIRLLRCLEQGLGAGAMSRIDVPHASLHRLQWPVQHLPDAHFAQESA